MSPVPEVPAPEVPVPEVRLPEVSVITPHLNQPELLRTLLASLHAQDFDMGRAEVIVVDNGSRVPPRDVVADFPGVRLVEERTPGPGPARNRGVALSARADPRLHRQRLPGRPALAADHPRAFRRRAGPRHPRRRHAADPRRPGPPDPGRGLRVRLRLPADALHPQQGLFGHRQHGGAALGARRGRAVRRHRRLRGPRLGPAGAGDRPRHPLEARRGRATSGAPDHGRAARQVRPQRQPRLQPPRRPASGAGRSGPPRRWRWPSRRWPRSRASSAPTGSRAGAAAASPSRAWPASGSTVSGRMLRALVSQEVRTASTRWNRDDRGMAGRDGG